MFVVIEEMYVCNLFLEFLLKRVCNCNLSCVMDLLVLMNEFLVKDLYVLNVRLKIYFYFLLFVNIVLMVIVGGLVYV